MKMKLQLAILTKYEIIYICQSLYCHMSEIMRCQNFTVCVACVCLKSKFCLKFSHVKVFTENFSTKCMNNYDKVAFVWKSMVIFN